MKRLLIVLLLISMITAVGCKDNGTGSKIEATPSPGGEADNTPGATDFPVAQITPNPFAYRWLTGQWGKDTLLEQEYILQKNSSNMSDNKYWTDIRDQKYALASKLESLVNDVTFKLTEKYDSSGSVLSAEKIKNIQSNIEYTEFSYDYKFGVITAKTSLLCWPTEDLIYQNATDKYNRNHKNVLWPGMPVKSAIPSVDGKFYFLITPFGNGWVSAGAIANVEESQWSEVYKNFAVFFRETENFCVVTAPWVEISGLRFDMGTTFVYEGKTNDHFAIKVPSRAADGSLEYIDIKMPSVYASDGFLDCTWENICLQAFKYYECPYSPDGQDNGLSYDLFITNIFKTMGIMLPSNLDAQRKCIGECVDVTQMTEDQKKEILANASGPCLLYELNNVSLLLGVDNAVYTIAPQFGSKVQQKSLSSLKALKYIVIIGE